MSDVSVTINPHKRGSSSFKNTNKAMTTKQSSKGILKAIGSGSMGVSAIAESLLSVEMQCVHHRAVYRQAQCNCYRAHVEKQIGHSMFEVTTARGPRESVIHDFFQKVTALDLLINSSGRMGSSKQQRSERTCYCTIFHVIRQVKYVC